MCVVYCKALQQNHGMGSQTDGISSPKFKDLYRHQSPSDFPITIGLTFPLLL